METKYGTDGAGSKIKDLFKNRAVIVSIVTLLLAVGVIVAVTVAANRSRKPGNVVGGTATGTETDAATGEGKPVMNGDETQVNYNANDTVADPVGGPSEEDPFSLKLPVNGKLMKGHDATLQVYSNTMGDYRIHLGVDISTPENGAVCAAADGKVSKVWTDPLMGQCLAIDHGNDILTVYKNLSAELAEGIAEGKAVTAGQQLGVVGDTAMVEMAEEPHLHLEMTINGLSVDPMTYFSAEDVASLKASDADRSYESTAVTGGK